MTFNESIKDCVSAILTRWQMISFKLLFVKHEIDNSLNTAATDGKKIFYNENFYSSLSFDQKLTLIAHEVLHILLGHHLRMRGKDHEMWNAACDYVINLILVQFGCAPLDNWLYDEKYKGMSAEEVYKQLQAQSKDKQDQQKEQSKQSGGSFSEPKNDDGSSMTDEQIKDELDKAAQDMQKSVSAAQRQEKAIKESKSLNDQTKKEKLDQIGASCSEIVNTLHDITDSRIDWRDVVSRFLYDSDNSTYSDQVLDLDEMANVDYQLIMDGRETQVFGNIALAVDCSGSLCHMAKQVASEAFHALELINKKELELFYISTCIHLHDTITSPDDIKEVGGGGTDFTCFFNHYLEECETQPMGLIFVTDGHVNFHNWTVPSFPVLWILTSRNKHFQDNVPFGDVVRMIDV